jgi:anaerobic magnesium-protoporphyrin IX monomethyl ester cyclase
MEGALAALKDEALYLPHADRHRLVAAFDVLSRAYALLSAPSAPSALSYGFRFQGSATHPPDLLRVLDSAVANPFPALYERFVMPTLVPPEAGGPDLIGIGITYEDQLVPALSLARLLRRQCPTRPIVAGGALVTRLAAAFVRRPALVGTTGPFAPFDAFVVQEGETALLAVWDRWQSGRAFDDTLPNLLVRTGGSAAAPTLARGPAHVEDVARLPTPDFRDLPLSQYLLGDPVLPLLTSRGCYWGKCAFCTHHRSYGPEGGFRARPPERIRADLDTLAARHGPSRLSLVDEALPPRHLRTVARHIRAGGLGHRFFADMRFEKGLSGARLEEAVAGGLRLLVFGLEAGSARVLQAMRKGAELDVAARILHDCRRQGIRTAVMVFIGFPGESVAEAHATARFLQDNAAVIDAWGVGAFSLMEGAPAYVAPAQFGITSVAAEPDEELSGRHDYVPRTGLAAGAASRIAAALERQRAADPRPTAHFPRELLAALK